tara:strand:- start:8040 stop:9593 length:1554 start_codon:yes stop_codon:yes gene_type:complete
VKNVKNIIVLGGGSAGWMTASTLIKEYPDKEITVIESPDTPIVGVGESTIGGIKFWTTYLGIDDTEFFKYTDATYKLSIRFEDFYKKGDGGFHYPFGKSIFNSEAKFNEWVLKKHIYPETHRSDFATCFYPQMALVNNNKLFDNEKNEIPFNFRENTAYHFDATKFGLFLKDRYCLPRGVKHIIDDIKTVELNDNGIQSLNNKYKADLYFDCTGFKSLLLGKSLNEEFESYSDMLPNNSAWATRLPYNNKKEDINCYTNCTAIENGWVWQIPLWSRWGTGYVYSDKFVDDETALQEFKNHLDKKGQDYSNAEFKKIKMRVGIHKRLWVKNVVGIGLAAGFIEPLESNGLFSVHEFIMRFIRNAQRDIITQWDRDNFTFQCKKWFRNFAEFVAMHYAMSNRDDTEYWRANSNKEWEPSLVNLTPANELGFFQAASLREYQNHFLGDGVDCIAYGMEWYPTEATHIKYQLGYDDKEFKDKFSNQIDKLNKRKDAWDMAVKDKTSFYDYHKQKFYNDRED